MRELNDACGVARTVEQEAIVVQMSAEAKMAAVELQVEECAQKVRAKTTQQHGVWSISLVRHRQ